MSRHPLALVLSGCLLLAACSDEEPSPRPKPSASPSLAVSAPPGPDPQKLEVQLLGAEVVRGGSVKALPVPEASLEEVCGAGAVPSDAQRRGAQAQEITSTAARVRQVVIAHAPGSGEAALGELRAALRSCSEYPTAKGVVRVRVLSVPDPGVATLALELSGASTEVLALTHAGDVTHVLRIRGGDAAASRALASEVIKASAAKLRVGTRPGGAPPSTGAAKPSASPAG